MKLSSCSLKHSLLDRSCNVRNPTTLRPPSGRGPIERPHGETLRLCGGRKPLESFLHSTGHVSEEDSRRYHTSAIQIFPAEAPDTIEPKDKPCFLSLNFLSIESISIIKYFVCRWFVLQQ